MEIYVMKKKFVLTLALVLMVAVTLTAATPLEVSGSFKAGYKFAIDKNTSVGFIDDSKVTVNAAFAGDFWGVEVDAPYVSGEDKTITAVADIFLDKALAEQGVDMGDVTLTLHAGTGVEKGAASVLADKAEFRKDRGIAMGATKNFGLSLGYAELADLYFSYDPTVKGPKMVVGVKATPINGVDAAVGFTSDYRTKGTNALAISAAADIKELADLDFGLAVTAEYMIEDLENVTHEINASVAGSYEGAELWVAYKHAADKKNALAAKAAYKTTIEDFTVGGGVKVSSADVAAFAKNYEVAFDASAEYKMGGVTYALGLGYTLNKANTGVFTVSPTVAISF
jgi:hypothetical protein